MNVEFLIGNSIKEVRDNIIRSKSFDFALLIIELYKQMLKEREYVLSKQLLRGGQGRLQCFSKLLDFQSDDPKANF